MENMNNEEKKAIENLKLNSTHNGFSLYDGTTNIFKLKDIEIVLNYIDKQQETLKKQSYTNKKLRNKIKTVRKERNKLQKENEELKSKCNLFYGISTNFINKDKIRTKIKELEGLIEEQEKIIKEFGEHEGNRKKLTMYKEQKWCLEELLGE